MNSAFYLVYAVLLFAGYAIYFKLARKFMIVDEPNHRTMHHGATIRGGGVVPFLLIAVVVSVSGTPGVYFLIGFVVIGLTGFLDDVINLPGSVRISLQVVAVILLLQELQLLTSGIVAVILIGIVATGTLNAFNFMDGLNGMTVGYSTGFVLTLLYINEAYYHFIDGAFLHLLLIALIVFAFFNFRKYALCFAGDVGSLSVAFFVLFLLIKLISETQQYIFILFLTLYGIDTIFTIVQRLYLKQNIFEAHRLHLFQVAVSKKQISHLQMSTIYMILQLGINLLTILMVKLSFPDQLFYSSIMLTGTALAYVVVKRKLILEAS